MNYKKLTDTMSIIPVLGAIHVIRPIDYHRNKTRRENIANYRGTGQALAGVLKPNETFQEFKDRWVEGQNRINK